MSDQGFLRGGKFLGIGTSSRDNRGQRRGSARRRSKISATRTGLRSAAIESLEDRLYMAGDTIPVHFEIPPDVAAMGVYIEVSGTLTQNYDSKAGVLQSGSVVYYNAKLGDYAVAGYGDQLTFPIAGNGATFNMPNTPIKAGQIVIGIGSPPNVYYNGQAIATPTSNTNPTNYFGLFEFAITGDELDVDLSEVDQVGFPFVITTDPTAASPANDGVGIPLTRAEMFERYGLYIASQGPTAELFLQSLTAGNGYRIEAPQDILDGQQAPVIGAPGYAVGGGLSIGTKYYYWVTAASPSGETKASNVMVALPYNNSVNGGNIPMQTVTMAWSALEDATSYNIYRSTTNNSATAGLIGSSATTTFRDTGYSEGTHNPPPNSYSFNALNSYFNNALDAFFTYYTSHTFELYRDGTLYSGTVNTNYQLEGHTYTVLVLHPQSSSTGPDYLIFKPYFSTNTNIAGVPPPPSWMPHPDQSPATMVMANDGAFNTGGFQPGVAAGVLSDLENSIVSAFNRGIATTFSIKPSNWASQPTLQTATATGGGNLDAGKTYYYLITANNQYGETTTSIERAITTTADNRSATLTWAANTEPTSYNIYRSETPGGNYVLVYSPANNNGHGQPLTSYTDDNTTTVTPATPPMYYAPGSTANWYAAFLHQNVTTNPATGVSINSLAYGFPYDDQGGNSTNMQAVFNSVTIDIMPWGHMPTPHGDGAAINILAQPNNGTLGGTTTIEFQVLNAAGEPLLGLTSVRIDVVGVQSGTYTVVTDPYSGIGVLSVINTAFGFDRMVLSLTDGVTATSRIYQVAGGFNPGGGGGGGGGNPGDFPGGFSGNTFPIPGQSSNPNNLGPNALPAQDVPNATSATWINAVPWGATEGELPTMLSAYAGNVFRQNSLEHGALGNWILMARTGHSITPELLPEPAPQTVPEKRDAKLLPQEREAKIAPLDRAAANARGTRRTGGGAAGGKDAAVARTNKPIVPPTGAPATAPQPPANIAAK